VDRVNAPTRRCHATEAPILTTPITLSGGTFSALRASDKFPSPRALLGVTSLGRADGGAPVPHRAPLSLRQVDALLDEEVKDEEEVTKDEE
jgi:hypothetical protein